MWTLLLFLSLLAFIGSIVGLFFRRIRQKATFIAFFSFVGIFLSIITLFSQDENEARQQGFLGTADMRAAKEAGISDPAAWQIRRDQIAKQAQEAERVEAERAETERAKAWQDRS